MLETTTFPVARCEGCARDVLVASDVSASGELMTVCAHCAAPIGDAGRQAGAFKLRMMGYDVEGEGPDTSGCGSGGCSGCGSSKSAEH